MTLIALLIGLIIERLATQIFHWRRMRWLDRIIDEGFALSTRLANWPAVIPIIILTVALVLPVAAVTIGLVDRLFGFPHLVLAVVVLFFSLGPNDIGEDVNEYCSALEEGDIEAIGQTAKALVEDAVPDDPLERFRCVEEAVCIQANNRLFAVIFWFVLLGPLGPLGAWAYRVTDLVRRRAVFQAGRDESNLETIGSLRDAAVAVHGWLAWIPARLTAVGYAVAGHFDDALAAWRGGDDQPAGTTSENSERLLARVGVAALALQAGEDEGLTARGVRGATAAKRLVFRLLLIWAVIISAMTLYGWTV
ncbi:MAG: regulatory signaling modulator protein AmpE [Gammaproteobacteria bacterium]|jgi:AmpE protein|nr:regulatory signaling modulator protein AmpE [Gammaproteobacteria bacterium]MDH3846766.1 regulatory signaling modulator protein AmpE [Gammaproteobacteria bacterium]MDH3864682.1 regulatory signaling modulator protein AmpE [Gammaproteobacteria bacterium]MDH3906628.1 regulatory signaling modulator protein AmpE [Gammaproteobacteria bacterium]MDH3954507.1 regulatory signaling modulator protein AmpE [Gammaproteobacteria bacterium]